MGNIQIVEIANCTHYLLENASDLLQAQIEIVTFFSQIFNSTVLQDQMEVISGLNSLIKHANIRVIESFDNVYFSVNSQNFVSFVKLVWTVGLESYFFTTWQV